MALRSCLLVSVRGGSRIYEMGVQIGCEERRRIGAEIETTRASRNVNCGPYSEMKRLPEVYKMRHEKILRE